MVDVVVDLSRLQIFVQTCPLASGVANLSVHVLQQTVHVAVGVLSFGGEPCSDFFELGVEWQLSKGVHETELVQVACDQVEREVPRQDVELWHFSVVVLAEVLLREVQCRHQHRPLQVVPNSVGVQNGKFTWYPGPSSEVLLQLG